MRRREIKKRTVITAFFAAVMVLFVAVGAGGTYALWLDRYEVPPVKIFSGSAELEISFLGSNVIEDIFPGEISAVPVQASNVGTSDLEVIATAVGPSDVSVTLVDSLDCDGTAPMAPVAAHISSGEDRTMCLQTLISPNSSNALQGQSSEFNVEFESTAGSWKDQDDLPISVQRGHTSIGLSTWNAGLLGLTAGGVEITNSSTRPLQLSMEVVGGGLLNLNQTYLSSSRSCNGILAPVLELLLGSGVYDLGEVQSGGTIYVCMTSLLGLGSRQVTVTAAYPDSQWITSSTSNSFRF